MRHLHADSPRDTGATAEDCEFLRRVDGLYVGLLTDDEIDQLDRLEAAGIARRSYEGTGGFLGLAKVRARGGVI